MTHTDRSDAADTYVLGHADAEVRRLLLQARLYDSHTEQALRLAGLRPGMRVLDVGCGPGDVSFIAARLVGPTGRVFGIDAAPEIVETARARAAELGHGSVTFAHCTVADLQLDEPVDAVVGRLILMHLPDPVAALRQLAGVVRPGGVLAFAEFDLGSVRTVPESPLFKAVADHILACFRAAGLDPAFGLSLHALFQRAGLPAPTLTLGSPLGGANDPDVLVYAVEVWRMMLPVAQQLGLASDELADPDALLADLRREAAEAGTVVQMSSLITAWTRTPA